MGRTMRTGRHDWSELHLRGGTYTVDQVLTKITPRMDDLALVNTALGDDGVVALVKGLDALRKQSAASQGQVARGFKSICIVEDNITGLALAALAAYAGRDGAMRSLQVQGRFTNIDDHLEQIMQSLNSSTLTELALHDPTSFPRPASARLITLLHSPYLRKLDLTSCDLGPESAAAISSYLASARSQSLRYLDIGANNVGLQASWRIVDVIQKSNYTLLGIGNEENSWLNECSSEEEDELEERDSRLEQSFLRNQELSSRVSQASLRCLPFARLVYNDPTLYSKRRFSARLRAKITPDLSTDNAALFRLLHLPHELIHLIVRHTSGDATAFSHSQFARLRKDAEGKAGLQRSIAAGNRVEPYPHEALEWDPEGAEEEWLALLGLDRWECDTS